MFFYAPGFYFYSVDEKVRIDKWLWAVRIFKTRSQAADACEKGKIKIAGVNVKASRLVKTNEVIEVKRGAFVSTYKVLQLTDKRMAGKLAPQFCQDMTPTEEIEKIKLHALALRMSRQPGTGRPTKDERRALDDFLSWDYN